MKRLFTVGTERMMQKLGKKEGSADPEEFEIANDRFKKLTTHYEEISSVVRDYCRTMAHLSELGQKWSVSMAEYGTGTTTELGVSLSRFSNRLQSLCEAQRILSQRVADELLKPANKFLAEDVEHAKPLKTEYKRAHYEYDSNVGALEKLKAKTPTDPKVALQEQRVNELRTSMNQLCSNATATLNYTFEKSDFDYLKGMVGVMRAYQAMLKDGLEMMQTLEPYLEELERGIASASAAATAPASPSPTGVGPSPVPAANV